MISIRFPTDLLTRFASTNTIISTKYSTLATTGIKLSVLEKVPLFFSEIQAGIQRSEETRPAIIGI
jgi:hypothetical protein